MLRFLLATLPLTFASLSDYTRLNETDITPCVPPCVRVGSCGDYPPNPNGPCNITWVAEQCSQLYGCVAFSECLRAAAASASRLVVLRAP